MVEKTKHSLWAFWQWFIWHYDKDAVVAHFQGQILIRGMLVINLPEMPDWASIIKDYNETMVMYYHGEKDRSKK